MIKEEKDSVLKEVSDFCDEVSNKEKIDIKRDKDKLILEINDFFMNDFSF